MGKLYTISPLILSDSIPRRDSYESVISEYFYLFNVYSTNPFKILNYMEFIDANFNFAFSKLKYNMIEYDYPDSLDESDMIRYINDKYKLSGQFELDRCYNMNTFNNIDYITNKECIIYFNDYALNDLELYDHNLLYDENDEILLNAQYLISYLNDKQTKFLLNELIDKIMDCQGDMSDNMIGYLDTDSVSEGILTLYQLKKFVEYIIEERRQF